jgi:hypothetical protein
MSVEERALAGSVVFSGLWSGLLAMLTLVMHPMLAAMNGRDCADLLRAFLPRARTAPFNYVAIVGMIVAPIVALVALSDDPGSAPFVLTAIGLALTVAGTPALLRLQLDPLRRDLGGVRAVSLGPFGRLLRPHRRDGAGAVRCGCRRLA